MDGAPTAATGTIHQPRSSTPSSSGSMDEGRFPPGTLLAQRYRVVSLLGRGGMGEVYRANDLLLGQTVALRTGSPGSATKCASRGRSPIPMSAACTTSAK
ncbi:MAG: hypothetical protein ABSB67_04460 [Bryobacteraceae bacterium]